MVRVPYSLGAMPSVVLGVVFVQLVASHARLSGSPGIDTASTSPVIASHAIWLSSLSAKRLRQLDYVGAPKAKRVQ
eukprot:SAG31_NODE_6228_length_2110_cov_2.222775_4_plen_75_part_01